MNVPLVNGLDDDRSEYCDEETQRIGFLTQLNLAETHNLPLFLHDRNTAGDFFSIMTEYLPGCSSFFCWYPQ